MNRVKYSVIMPVYNSEKYIKKAMDMLLNQNYSEMEIIIVDDGSTDHTAQIIGSSYICEKVKYFYKENEGPGIARKYGIEKCNGQYVCFLDSDDHVMPGYFHSLDKAIEEDPDIVEYGYIHEKTGKKCFPETVNTDRSFTSRLLQSKMITSLWCRVFRRELFENLEHSTGYYSEDFFLNFQIYRKAKKITVINEILYCYRYNLDSLTRKKAVDFEQALSHIQVRELLLEKYTDLNHEEEVIIKTWILYHVFKIYGALNEQYGKVPAENEKILDEIFKKYFCLDILRHAPIKKLRSILPFAFFKKGTVKIYKVWRKIKNRVRGAW